jgi:hypothetical protein
MLAMVTSAAAKQGAMNPLHTQMADYWWQRPGRLPGGRRPGALQPVLDAVMAAARAGGCDGHTDTDPWLPHISIAYSHATGPAAAVIAALGRWLPSTGITIRSVSLVARAQVGRSWQWRPVAEVHLAGG